MPQLAQLIIQSGVNFNLKGIAVSKNMKNLTFKYIHRVDFVMSYRDDDITDREPSAGIQYGSQCGGFVCLVSWADI